MTTSLSEGSMDSSISPMSGASVVVVVGSASAGREGETVPSAAMLRESLMVVIYWGRGVLRSSGGSMIYDL